MRESKRSVGVKADFSFETYPMKANCSIMDADVPNCAYGADCAGLSG